MPVQLKPKILRQRMDHVTEPTDWQRVQPLIQDEDVGIGQRVACCQCFARDGLIHQAGGNIHCSLHRKSAACLQEQQQ